MSHFPISQATIMALVGVLVTGTLALVPSWAPYRQVIISALGGLVSVGFLIANAIHAHAAARPHA